MFCAYRRKHILYGLQLGGISGLVKKQGACLLEILNNPVILAILTAVIGGKFFHYKTQLADQNSDRFKQLYARIEGMSTRESVYNTGLGKFLAWTDRFFEGSGADKVPPVLSARTYDRCLLMALFYPVMAAMLGWLAFGNAGELGRAIGLEDLPTLLLRLLALVYLAVLAALLFKFMRDDTGWQSLLWFAVCSVILFVGSYLLSFMGVPFIVIYAFIVVVFIFVVVNNRTTGAFAGTFTFVVVGAVAGAFTVVVASAGAGIAAFAIMWLIDKKPSLLRIILIGVSLLGFVGVFAIPLLMPEMTNNRSAIGFLLGFMLLPLVNVPFDFLSTALTRTLLRKSRDQNKFVRRLGYSLADLGLALVFMLLLSIAMVICLQAFNSIAGADMINVRAVLQDIIDNPAASQHFWLYFALFSTLLPTMIHMVIGVSSLISFRLAKRSWVLEKMDNINETVRYEVASLLTFQFFASIALVFAGGWALLWLFGSALGLSDILLVFLLDVQTATAGLLG